MSIGVSSKNLFSCSCSIDLYMIQKIVLFVVRVKTTVLSLVTGLVLYVHAKAYASPSFSVA